MKKVFLFLSLSVLASPAVAQLRSEQCRNGVEAEQEVLALDAARIDALLRNDVAFLESITDDSYSHVESSGGSRDKDEFIAGRRNRPTLFSTFVIDENNARIFCNVAVVTGTYRNAYLTGGGTKVEKHARHLRVYVYREGQWKNVAHQATDTRRSEQ
jgi:hypothetical protein